jgi:hypothetical protein
MLQIAYFSTAVLQQDATTVHNILTTARRNNRRDQITGLLVAGSNRYLQVIEGPDRPVQALYNKIVADDRHMAVAQFSRRHITHRDFGSWSMAFRRPDVGDECNTLREWLQALTSVVPDGQLKQQIVFFARAMVNTDPMRAPPPAAIRLQDTPRDRLGSPAAL